MGLDIIDRLKKEKQMTSEELAERSKVPLGTLNKILNGQTKNPTLETMFAIAHALGCSVDDFDDEKIAKRQVEEFTLSSEEKQLVFIWRKLSKGEQAMLMKMIKGMESQECAAEDEPVKSA